MAHFTLTVQQIIKGNVDIFDFDYPIFNDEYKKKFESDFIDYFLLEEIAHETIGLFKLRLKSKLNLIMPIYNKIYESQLLEQRILDNYDVTENYQRDVINKSNRESLNISNVKNNNVSKELYKDAPKTKIDIDKFDTVTNLSKNISDMISDSTMNNEENINDTTTEKWERNMKGNIGVQTDSDAITKYWTSLRNVTLEIFENELSCLFMGIL